MPDRLTLDILDEIIDAAHHVLVVADEQPPPGAKKGTTGWADAALMRVRKRVADLKTFMDQTEAEPAAVVVSPPSVEEAAPTLFGHAGDGLDRERADAATAMSLARLIAVVSDGEGPWILPDFSDEQVDLLRRLREVDG